MTQINIATLPRAFAGRDINSADMKPSPGTGNFYTKMVKPYSPSNPIIISHCYYRFKAPMERRQVFFIVTDNISTNQIDVIVYGSEQEAGIARKMIKEELAVS